VAVSLTLAIFVWSCTATITLPTLALILTLLPIVEDFGADVQLWVLLETIECRNQ
jgi:hypothetical protein